MSNLVFYFIIWFHCINAKCISFHSVSLQTSSVNTKDTRQKYPFFHEMGCSVHFQAFTNFTLEKKRDGNFRKNGQES